jgi:hypothetical protein
VKHFKNSQQIDYATDHGNSHADRERNSPSFFVTYFTDAQFVFWGFMKDTVFVHPLPANLQNLRNHITAAVARVDRDTLTRVWNEMDYRIDVCRITKGGRIEHL